MARQSNLEPKPRQIDTRNRVALTPDVMRALGVKAGDYVSFDIEGGVVRLHRLEWSIKPTKK